MFIENGSGFLNFDPEVFETKKGSTVVRFVLSNKEEYNEEVVFHNINCVAFGDVAKDIQDELKKGMLVNVIKGILKTEKYTDKDKNERTTVKLHVIDYEIKELKTKTTGSRRKK